MDIAELRRLFAAHLAGTISPEDYQRLTEAAHEQDANDWQSALEPLISETEATEPFDKQDWEPVLQHILYKEASVVRLQPRQKWRWMAAASIILLFAIGSYFLFFNKTQQGIDTGIAKQDVTAPTIHRATLKLADGRIIILDTAANGNLTMNVSKVNEGELKYAPDAATALQYHTLFVPNGSRPMQLELADGTEVWLNAGSSITYPTAFPGSERKVSMTGEAYFEVAKNTGKKFFVTVKGITTEVLGTHFNINSYDESSFVTLLEGKIAVNGIILSPGQQAQVGNTVKINNDADLEEVMAWKNGLFKFNKADIRTIMKQVARWYDVDIQYEGEVSGSFGGTIPNTVNVSKLLAMLELTNHVRFHIDGRTITVKPYSK